MDTQACPECRKPIMVPMSGSFVCPHCDKELKVIADAPPTRKTSGSEIGVRIGLAILAVGVVLAILGALLKAA